MSVIDLLRRDRTGARIVERAERDAEAERRAALPLRARLVAELDQLEADWTADQAAHLERIEAAQADVDETERQLQKALNRRGHAQRVEYDARIAYQQARQRLEQQLHDAAPLDLIEAFRLEMERLHDATLKTRIVTETREMLDKRTGRMVPVPIASNRDSIARRAKAIHQVLMECQGMHLEGIDDWEQRFHEIRCGIPPVTTDYFMDAYNQPKGL